MPIFEYYCQRCHQEFEEIVFGDELPTCPDCGAQKCQKLVSRPCRHHQGGSADFSDGSMAPSAASASKCSGCSGGNCATC